jgi:hypothetical protein
MMENENAETKKRDDISCPIENGVALKNNSPVGRLTSWECE